jgi:tellurite resistance protein
MAKRNFPSSRRNNTQVTLEPDLAIAVIAISSAFADGEELGHEEDYALGEMLCSISGFEDYSEQDYVELYNRGIAVINEEGWGEALNQAVASLPNKDYREAAYITALTVIAVDGEFPEEEEEFLAGLQEALKISDVRAEKMMDEFFCEDEEEEEEEED